MLLKHIFSIFKFDISRSHSQVVTGRTQKIQKATRKPGYKFESQTFKFPSHVFGPEFVL